MALSTLWVVAEPSGDSFSTASLELLSHARTLATNVAAVTWGEGGSLNAQAGEYGATTLYDVGALDGALPGVPVAAAIQALITANGAPDALLIPNSYDGRDIAGRLSARLDRPVLTNATALNDDGGLVTEHPVFGGSFTVRAKFTGEGPGIVVVRAKSFAAEPSGGSPAAVVAAPAGDTGATGRAVIMVSHVEARTGPKLEDATVVVSGGRGLGEAGAYALRRVWHLGRDPTHGGDEGFEEHRGDQQRRGRADLPDRRSGHRGRRAQGVARADRCVEGA